LLVIIRAVGLVVGLLSQPVKGRPVFSTCFLSVLSMSLQMRSDMSRIRPKALVNYALFGNYRRLSQQL